MFRAVYTVLLVVGLFLMAPVLVFRAIRHRKYIGSLSERLGAPNIRPSKKPTLWIHAVSVGEVVAVEQFVREAVTAFPNWRVAVSTTTATGQKVARDRFPDLDVFYFPIDLPGPVSRAMSRIGPGVLCLVETEIWPNVLAACRKRRVPVAIVNGRLSDNSYRGYARLRWILRGVLAAVARFLMQSAADADRMKSLGADPTRVSVTGNMKYDLNIADFQARTASRRSDLASIFALDDERPLIVAGSTGPAEEAMLIDALKELRGRVGLGDTRMMIAPRHPERFDEVARLLAASGLGFVRRSDAGSQFPANDAAILLLDSIGELAAAYSFATVAFVGGSLVPRGGHSILEPALFGRPIVVGPHTENFRQVVSDFLAAGAVVQLDHADANANGLARAFESLLTDEKRRRLLGASAAAVLDANRGATMRTIAAIRVLLDPSDPRT